MDRHQSRSLPYLPRYHSVSPARSPRLDLQRHRSQPGQRVLYIDGIPTRSNVSSSPSPSRPRKQAIISSTPNSFIFRVSHCASVSDLTSSHVYNSHEDLFVKEVREAARRKAESCEDLYHKGPFFPDATPSESGVSVGESEEDDNASQMSFESSSAFCEITGDSEFDEDHFGDRSKHLQGRPGWKDCRSPDSSCSSPNSLSDSRRHRGSSEALSRFQALQVIIPGAEAGRGGRDAHHRDRGSGASTPLAQSTPFVSPRGSTSGEAKLSIKACWHSDDPFPEPDPDTNDCRQARVCFDSDVSDSEVKRSKYDESSCYSSYSEDNCVDVCDTGRVKVLKKSKSPSRKSSRGFESKGGEAKVKSANVDRYFQTIDAFSSSVDPEHFTPIPSPNSVNSQGQAGEGSGPGEGGGEMIGPDRTDREWWAMYSKGSSQNTEATNSMHNTSIKTNKPTGTSIPLIQAGKYGLEKLKHTPPSPPSSARGKLSPSPPPASEISASQLPPSPTGVKNSLQGQDQTGGGMGRVGVGENKVNRGPCEASHTPTLNGEDQTIHNNAAQHETKAISCSTESDDEDLKVSDQKSFSGRVNSHANLAEPEEGLSSGSLAGCLLSSQGREKLASSGPSIYNEHAGSRNFNTVACGEQAPGTSVDPTTQNEESGGNRAADFQPSVNTAFSQFSRTDSQVLDSSAGKQLPLCGSKVADREGTSISGASRENQEAVDSLSPARGFALSPSTGGQANIGEAAAGQSPQVIKGKGETLSWDSPEHQVLSNAWEGEETKPSPGEQGRETAERLSAGGLRQVEAGVEHKQVLGEENTPDSDTALSEGSFHSSSALSTDSQGNGNTKDTLDPSGDDHASGSENRPPLDVSHTDSISEAVGVDTVNSCEEKQRRCQQHPSTDAAPQEENIDPVQSSNAENCLNYCAEQSMGEPWRQENAFIDSSLNARAGFTRAAEGAVSQPVRVLATAQRAVSPLDRPEPCQAPDSDILVIPSQSRYRRGQESAHASRDHPVEHAACFEQLGQFDSLTAGDDFSYRDGEDILSPHMSTADFLSQRHGSSGRPDTRKAQFAERELFDSGNSTGKEERGNETGSKTIKHVHRTTLEKIVTVEHTLRSASPLNSDPTSLSSSGNNLDIVEETSTETILREDENYYTSGPEHVGVLSQSPRPLTLSSESRHRSPIRTHPHALTSEPLTSNLSPRSQAVETDTCHRPTQPPPTPTPLSPRAGDWETGKGDSCDKNAPVPGSASPTTPMSGARVSSTGESAMDRSEGRGYGPLETLQAQLLEISHDPFSSDLKPSQTSQQEQFHDHGEATSLLKQIVRGDVEDYSIINASDFSSSVDGVDCVSTAYVTSSSERSKEEQNAGIHQSEIAGEEGSTVDREQYDNDYDYITTDLPRSSRPLHRSHRGGHMKASSLWTLPEETESLLDVISPKSSPHRSLFRKSQTGQELDNTPTQSMETGVANKEQLMDGNDNIKNPRTIANFNQKAAQSESSDIDESDGNYSYISTTADSSYPSSSLSREQTPLTESESSDDRMDERRVRGETTDLRIDHISSFHEFVTGLEGFSASDNSHYTPRREDQTMGGSHDAFTNVYRHDSSAIKSFRSSVAFCVSGPDGSGGPSPSQEVTPHASSAVSPTGWKMASALTDEKAAADVVTAQGGRLSQLHAQLLSLSSATESSLYSSREDELNSSSASAHLNVTEDTISEGSSRLHALDLDLSRISSCASPTPSDISEGSVYTSVVTAEVRSSNKKMSQSEVTTTTTSTPRKVKSLPLTISTELVKDEATANKEKQFDKLLIEFENQICDSDGLSDFVLYETRNADQVITKKARYEDLYRMFTNDISEQKQNHVCVINEDGSMSTFRFKRFLYKSHTKRQKGKKLFKFLSRLGCVSESVRSPDFSSNRKLKEAESNVQVFSFGSGSSPGKRSVPVLVKSSTFETHKSSSPRATDSRGHSPSSSSHSLDSWRSRADSAYSSVSESAPSSARLEPFALRIPSVSHLDVPTTTTTGDDRSFSVDSAYSGTPDGSRTFSEIDDAAVASPRPEGSKRQNMDLLSALSDVFEQLDVCEEEIDEALLTRMRHGHTPVQK